MKAYCSANLVMLLEPGYSIKAYYSTGGYETTLLLADKTYFNIIYSNIN